MVKKYFPGNPIILGIGDGFDDCLMMQKCDVSIQVLSKDSKLCSAITRTGDLVVTKFDRIHSLIFGKNQIFTKKNSLIQLFLFYSHFTISFPFSLFCWYSNFSASFLNTEIIGGFILFVITMV